jgi:glyoxylase-like metal-dependent hydrolase (beta-lactamase superfamily II)
MQPALKATILPHLIQLLDRRCNVFLYSTGGRHMLIDTNRKRYRPALLTALRSLCIDKIDVLILTHTHYDHAENAAYIKSRFGAKVIVHEAEAEYLKTGRSPLPAGTLFPTRLLAHYARQYFQSRFDYEACLPDATFTESLDLSAFGFPVRLIHTPGHSSGSISVLIESTVAIAGDTLFGKFPTSVFPPFADEVPELYKSWQLLLGTGCSVFYPGHGRAVSREVLQRCVVGS